jgi:hypothetical protein
MALGFFDSLRWITDAMQLLFLGGSRERNSAIDLLALVEKSIVPRAASSHSDRVSAKSNIHPGMPRERKSRRHLRFCADECEENGDGASVSG